ncbi:sugar phosphate nucleotidyltransferase [Pseudogemmatithrix spongiicola]|uniref:Sugar phosphate nucleotidyltransferase n=1 Tax=Pseudogemmatithrix spongiicola TaxID=3062599 RepID=A0AA49Q981_9BACT|nr:sugar phosphate nucleotidyltransferase [Gemmatimonadaceae bacterium 'strain 138']WKW15900.1 sugar phosphate nucleotidyltransferase [Gemmatimonadaceae bacterium 'strain 318']
MRATLAVILARGLGTRLRADDGTALDAGQAAAASAGTKGLVPLAGRPLLDFVLHELAEGGVRDVVLVVPPGDSPLRTRYDVEHPPARLRVRFAVQEEPRGTAQALLSAREAVCAALGAPSDTGGRRHFLMCNADNLYAAPAIEALVDARGPGVIAYDADALVRDSGIEAERVSRFALLDIGDDDMLRDIVEKPEQGHPLLKATPRWVSMNLWRFRDTIFDACTAISPSPRGELELADAVREAMRRGERFAVHRRAEAVFDLTHRRDIATLEARLAGRVPKP